MLWCYDNAIVEDLRQSFNTSAQAEPAVYVVPPESVLDIAAQVQNDKIKFPVVAVNRDDNVPIDNDRFNFSLLHQGIATVFDKEKNEIYYEKVMPIKLEYDLVCLATNTTDVDELVRELMFKYTSQYFITLKVPYESKRKIRCGLRIDPSDVIERQSSTSDYLQEGKLYSASIRLYVDGAVLLSYTPAKLTRTLYETDIREP